MTNSEAKNMLIDTQFLEEFDGDRENAIETVYLGHENRNVTTENVSENLSGQAIENDSESHHLQENIETHARMAGDEVVQADNVPTEWDELEDVLPAGVYDFSSMPENAEGKILIIDGVDVNIFSTTESTFSLLQFVIKNGGALTLQNINICNRNSDPEGLPTDFQLSCLVAEGSADNLLRIEGMVNLTTIWKGAGVAVNCGSKLTISGSGKLYSESGYLAPYADYYGGAGIGGEYGKANGDIICTSGSQGNNDVCRLCRNRIR